MISHEEKAAAIDTACEAMYMKLKKLNEHHESYSADDYGQVLDNHQGHLHNQGHARRIRPPRPGERTPPRTGSDAGSARHGRRNFGTGVAVF